MTRRYAVWIGLVTITAAIVLNTSLQTRQQQDRLSEITSAIKAEEERIRVLTAEWHSLKTPERLEALAARHLPGYTAIKPLQLAALSDVPDRLPEADAPVAVASAAPVEAPKPAVIAPVTRQVASVPPPRARPAATRPATDKPDELARLIARNDVATPAPAPRPNAARDDGIRMIIERQPQDGVTRTSFGGAE